MRVPGYTGGIPGCLVKCFKAKGLTLLTKSYMLRSLKPGVVVNAAQMRYLDFL